MGGTVALSPSTTELTVRVADMRGRGLKKVTFCKFVDICEFSIEWPNSSFLQH